MKVRGGLLYTNGENGTDFKGQKDYYGTAKRQGL